MRKILIPIDHSAIAETLVDFAAGLMKDFVIEEIVLLKAVQVPAIARVLPSPDMLLMPEEEFQMNRTRALDRGTMLMERLRAGLTRPVKMHLLIPEGSVDAVLESAISQEQPGLIIIGNDPQHQEVEDVSSEAAISIARSSTVPVLLVPKGARYRKPERLLIPTSFKNMERLRSFDLFLCSQLWQSVEIIVFHAIETKKEEQYEEGIQTISSLFRGMKLKIQFKTCKSANVPDGILKCAEENQVDLVFALPGKHGLLHQLTHKSVTENFALRSGRPVFLLK